MKVLADSQQAVIDQVEQGGGHATGGHTTGAAVLPVPTIVPTLSPWDEDPPHLNSKQAHADTTGASVERAITVTDDVDPTNDAITSNVGDRNNSDMIDMDGVLELTLDFTDGPPPPLVVCVDLLAHTYVFATASVP